MDVGRMSINKNDAEKPFINKALNNHTSETYVPGVYNTYAPTRYEFICYSFMFILTGSVVI